MSNVELSPEIEIDENWPVESSVNFQTWNSDEIPFSVPSGGNLSEYDIRLTERGWDAMRVVGIDENICDTRQICPEDYFRVENLKIILQQRIDLKEMGGREFKFGLQCSNSEKVRPLKILLTNGSFVQAWNQS